MHKMSTKLIMKKVWPMIQKHLESDEPYEDFKQRLDAYCKTVGWSYDEFSKAWGNQ